MSPKPTRPHARKGETHYNKFEKPEAARGGKGEKDGGRPSQRRSGSREDEGRGADKPFARKPFRENKDRDEAPRSRKPADGERPKRSFSADRPDRKPDDRSDRPIGRDRGESRPPRAESGDRSKSFRSDKKEDRGDRPYRSDERSAPKYPRRENDRPERAPRGEGESRGPERRPFDRDKHRDDTQSRTGKPPYDGPRRSDNDAPGSDKKPFRKPFSDSKRDGGDRPYRAPRGDNDAPKERGKPYGDRDKTGSRDGGDNPYSAPRRDGDAPKENRKPYGTRSDDSRGGDDKPRKPYGTRSDDSRGGDDKPRPFRSARPGADEQSSDNKPFRAPRRRNEDEVRKVFKQKEQEFSEEQKPADGPMTLNKYLAHCGISSRRAAAILVKEGKVAVNDVVHLEPGYRVQDGDKITLDGKLMKPQSHLVYILLNKPKDFLTTTEDDRGRRTVMELVASAEAGRMYPIGRLDRNTTGVLLLTNDGDLAQKLAHPKHEIKKVYQVTLDKDLTKADFDKIVTGLTLEDGVANVDQLAYLETKNEVGLEIHSGRNRIVRRIFESLGYDVVKLDRVMYAGLTKKNVPRGKWRFLTDREVVLLKHFKV